jgi:16S rRNA (cytidine1402-2'-O)-methyltransferase
MPGILYLVATPIGNLEDITLRALRVLKEVDLIAAEDTRHTGQLLKHFDIKKPLCSFYSHNQDRRSPELVEKLLAGAKVALVTDAGTPGISDPAVSLVSQAVQAGITIVPVPGATALISALVCSGLDPSRFLFLGFLPLKSGKRARLLEQLKEEPGTLVAYESPHRISKTLADLAAVFAPRQAVLGRELTKMHEEFERGDIAELALKYQTKKPRGEYVIVIAGKEG